MPQHAALGSFGDQCARNAAERSPRELRGPMLRPFLGPRSSRFEGVERCCILRVADRGLERI
eukprot:2913864-Alexandrium_andersonii.AAC.1